MNRKPIVRPPDDEPWIGLIAALTWIAFDHSFNLETLLSDKKPVGGTLREIHPNLQAAWEMLADRASEGGIDLRGKRMRERHHILEKKERKLNSNDLRNCRHLSWPKDGAGIRKARVEWYWDESVTEEISTNVPSKITNEERLQKFFHPDTLSIASEGYQEAFARAVEHIGFDYVDVVVSRRGLMRAWPVRGKRKAASLANENEATQWLDTALAERPADSNFKSAIVGEMQTMFGLTPTQSNRVWKNVAPYHEDWHSKRGAPKGARNKTNRKI